MSAGDDVTLTFPLLPLTAQATMRVPAEREQETRDALATLEQVAFAQWEANLRAERAGVVHKRA